MFHIVGLVLLSGATITLGMLYWRAITDSNHLACFIGLLLLDDSVRAAQKQGFETWLRGSSATNAQVLSTRALQAIQNLANRLAAGDPSGRGSSVLGFHALVWNHKNALKQN